MRYFMTLLLLALSQASLAQAPNPPEPAPAFAGQTDAPPPVVASTGFRVETVADELAGPWAMAFLPNGHILFTQRAGTMRTISRKESCPTPSPVCHPSSVSPPRACTM